MVAVQKYLCFYHSLRKFSKTELKKIYNSISDFETYLFIFFNKWTFNDTNKSRKYLNELKVEKSKKKNKKENIVDLINSMYEEPQMTKKVFSLEKYKEWYKKEFGQEYIETDFDWVNQCIGLTREECEKIVLGLGDEWMVEVDE